MEQSDFPSELGGTVPRQLSGSFHPLLPNYDTYLRGHGSIPPYHPI